MKRFIFVLFFCFSLISPVFAQDDFVWKNDLRSKFLNNETIIMEINIRNFNSNDIDGNGFIDTEAGETKGTFLNAIDRLDEIKNLGVNTLHILPITPTGKLKALGTAGSLYAAADFSSINKDFYDSNSDLTLEQQAEKFINEAHKRNIRVIIDVPACGSYDLFLQRPDLFVRNNEGEPVLPSDWTDVRLLSTGTEEKIDSNTYSLYKDFVKYVIKLGADGIRADVAHSKTKTFWQELIKYSRSKDPEFLWLAESSESWNEAISPQAVFTPYDKLLEAGFDGFYGSFFNLKDWHNSSQLNEQFTYTFSILKSFSDKKSVIGSFTTHDEVSPVLINGEQLSTMIIWLNSTLPVNSYYVDGFQTGDDYNYPMGNKEAISTNTDDNLYFTHNGKIDIFNFSRKPGGNNSSIKNEFIMGNDVKLNILPILNNGTYTQVKVNNPNIFAYTFEYNNKRVFTAGNLDFKKDQRGYAKLGKINKNTRVIPIKISKLPEIKRNKLLLDLKAGEIIVLIINSTDK